MKPLVIYHDNCADGFGAAFAAWLKLGDEAEYLPMQYGDAEKKWFGETFCSDEVVSTLDRRDIYILDFSFERQLMEYLFAHAKRVVWLDHHKTAFEMWRVAAPAQIWDDCRYLDRHHITLDNNRSGAMLAWKYFHPGTGVPMLIRHIDDYDRWVFAMEGTKAFNKAIWSYAPWSFEQWKGWFQSWGDGMLPGKETLFLAEGEAILRAHEQNVAAVVKGAGRKCHIKVPYTDDAAYALAFASPKDGMPLTGLAANCPPHLASDVGHALATQSGTFGLLWSVNKDGKCLCSLRSNGDYDVSAIAKAWGGGGHLNAAGFEVDVQTLLGWLK
jgi:uncharacterized protein